MKILQLNCRIMKMACIKQFKMRVKNVVLSRDAFEKHLAAISASSTLEDFDLAVTDAVRIQFDKNSTKSRLFFMRKIENLSDLLSI